MMPRLVRRPTTDKICSHLVAEQRKGFDNTLTIVAVDTQIDEGHSLLFLLLLSLWPSLRFCSSDNPSIVAGAPSTRI